MNLLGIASPCYSLPQISRVVSAARLWGHYTAEFVSFKRCLEEPDGQLDGSRATRGRKGETATDNPK